MEPYIIVCKYFKQYTCTHDFYICLILHTGVDPGFQVRGGGGAHAGCGPPPWFRPCTITDRVANDHFSHLKNNQLKKSLKTFKG
jgi:hypothetical protein